KQIGTHAGHVAYVVTHVVGDGCRISDVVFWDSRFYFAHKIGPDVSSFGIDTAANASKKCNRLSTQGESCQYFERFLHLQPVDTSSYIDNIELVEDDKQGTKTQYSQAGNSEPHHGTSCERYF